MSHCFIKSIRLTNFLSYGPQGMELQMKPLNVIVGPNGAGKSNLLEAIGFIAAAPRGLAGPVRTGGGVADWIYRGVKGEEAVAKLSLVLENTPENHKKFNDVDLNYRIEFSNVKDRFEVLHESVVASKPTAAKRKPYVYYDHDAYQTVINVADADGNGQKRHLESAEIAKDASIFSQIKDRFAYPELTYLNEVFSKIRLYREWHFGANSAVRQSQPTDADDATLAEDFSNIAMFSNRISDDYGVKKRFLEAVQDLYDGICDINVGMTAGRAILRIQEKAFAQSITANRLSDGSLRFICLAALLLDPTPPPVICIDEPELGMHPDMIGTLAKLIKEASERTQIIVTTHSALFLDSFADTPDALVVCERENGASLLERKNVEEMRVWLAGRGTGRRKVRRAEPLCAVGLNHQERQEKRKWKTKMSTSMLRGSGACATTRARWRAG